VVVSPVKIVIVDFKYGQGVVVVAESNPQLMLYGLGALEVFGDVLGVTQDVDMWICQPRVSNGTTKFEVTAADLRAWREDEVLPLARETQHPDARFGPSEAACRWCPAAGVCVPRMTHVVQRDFGNPDVMDASELAAAFRRLGEIRDWCNAVEAEALKQAYSEGTPLPGLKVVMSGGKRSITDVDTAVERLVEAGYSKEAVTRLQMQTLSALEKLVGNTTLPEVLGDVLLRSPGRPALVDEDDGREAVTALTQAAEDFQEALEE
jgi:hypothetical protein